MAQSRSVLAGNSSTGSFNGVGSLATFSSPVGLSLAGNSLYVADSLNHCVRRISMDNLAVITLAGTCGTTGSTDGSVTLALFNKPVGLVPDNRGGFLIGDSGNARLRFISGPGLASTVSTFAGTGFDFSTAASSVNGAATSATFSTPTALTIYNNQLFVMDPAVDTIRAIAPPSPPPQPPPPRPPPPRPPPQPPPLPPPLPPPVRFFAANGT
jgi:hypothetical protein